MKIGLFLLVTWVCISVASADYGDLKIGGGGRSGKLEFQQSDGSWGYVCSSGFDYRATEVTCKQLGYDRGSYYKKSYYSYYELAVCYTKCYDYETEFKDCNIHQCSNYDSCSHIVYLICYNDDYDDYDNSDSSDGHYDSYDDSDSSDGHYDSYDDSSSGGSSAGSVIGAVCGGMAIFVFVVFIVGCRVYIRYSIIRRRNQQRTIIVTQRQTPRILIARVTRTVSSGPPPPPAYTPLARDAGYTPVPARGYQPVPTTDYSPAEPTNTPSVAPYDIPSDLPPEYTPTVSTNVPISVPPVNENSTQ